MENIVLNLDLSKKLKHLGINKSAMFAWIRPNMQKNFVLGSRLKFKSINSCVLGDSICFELGGDEYWAYTAEELIDMMPKYIEKNNCYNLHIVKNDWHGNNNAFTASYQYKNKKIYSCNGHDLVTALANLYIEFLNSKNS